MLRCLLTVLNEFKQSNQESDQKILEAMRQNPTITIRELQEHVGMSESGVKKVIKQLRIKGLVGRVGSKKGGYWEVK